MRRLVATLAVALAAVVVLAGLAGAGPNAKREVGRAGARALAAQQPTFEAPSKDNFHFINRNHFGSVAQGQVTIETCSTPPTTPAPAPGDHHPPGAGRARQGHQGGQAGRLPDHGVHRPG